MSCPQPSIVLKLFCEEGRPHFFWCTVYADEKTMLEAFKHLYGDLPVDGKRFGVGAVCVGYRPRAGKDVGCVLFHRTNLHPAVLAHEFAHAASSYARLRKYNPAELLKTKRLDGDERNATCVGYLMQQFYSQQAHRAFCIKGTEASAA